MGIPRARTMTVALANMITGAAGARVFDWISSYDLYVTGHLLGMAMYWLIVCVSSGTAAARWFSTSG